MINLIWGSSFKRAYKKKVETKYRCADMIEECLAFVIFMCFTLPSFAGTLLDDFSDGNFDCWKETWMKQDQTTWKVDSGVLTGENPLDWGAYLLIGEEGWGNYEIECNARITAIKGNIPSFGFGLRHNCKNGAELKTIGLALVASANPLGPAGAYCVYLANDNVFTRKIEAFPVEIGKWYHIKASVQADIFDFEVDGRQFISIQDKTLASGAIGLEAHAGISQYDNVVIRGDGVPDSNLSVLSKSKLTTAWGKIKYSM